MGKIDDIIKELNKIIPVNKAGGIIIALFSLVVLWGGIRSCSNTPGYDPSKIFVIARDPSWYPLDLMGKEKSVVAFTNDLLLYIAQEKSVRLQLISVSANAIFEGLESEKYNAIISSLMPNPENNQIYNFSDTFFFVGPVLIVPTESTITSFDQMSDKVIGIPSNPNISINIGRYKSFYKPYENMTEAFTDLYRNGIDGILLPVMQANTYIDTFHKGAFKIVSVPLSDLGLRLVAKQSNESDYVLHLFDEGLKEAIKNGTYNALCKKWGLINPFTSEHDHEPSGS